MKLMSGLSFTWYFKYRTRSCSNFLDWN